MRRGVHCPWLDPQPLDSPAPPTQPLLAIGISDTYEADATSAHGTAPTGRAFMRRSGTAGIPAERSKPRAAMEPVLPKPAHGWRLNGCRLIRATDGSSRDGT